MKPMTIEDTIQIGYDCGLTTLDEAYSQIMLHYDCFFLISDFAAQRATYDKLFFDAGFVEKDHEGSRIKDITLVDAAKQIGYEIKPFELVEQVIQENNNLELDFPDEFRTQL